MSYTPEEIRVWRAIARVVDRDVRKLDAEVVTLMKAHATVKAAGPAHTSRHLEQLAQLLIGPRWRDFAQEATDARA